MEPAGSTTPRETSAMDVAFKPVPPPPPRHAQSAQPPPFDPTASMPEPQPHQPSAHAREDAELALRLSEERYRQLVENCHDAIFVHADTRILYANAAAERMFRSPPGQLVGRSIFDLVPSEMAAHIRDRLHTTYADRKTTTLEEQTLRRLDGTPIRVETLACPVTFDGRAAAQAVVRDLTDRHASEQRYRRLFESSPMPMWLFDEQTLAFLAVNEAAVEKYGFSRDEFLTMTIRDIRPSEDLPRLQREMANPAETRRLGVWRHRTKDGLILLVDIASHRVEFEGRRARLVIAMDVTETQKSQDEVAEWRHRYEAAIWSSGQVLYDWDLINDRVVWAGDTTSILGHGLADLNAIDSWTSLVHPDDVAALTAELDRTMQDGSPFSLEYRMRRGDGAYMYVSDKAHFIRAPEGRLIRMIGFVADVSDKHRAEADRRRLEAERESLYARLKLQIERMPIGCVLCDQDMHFLELNPAAEEIFGYKRDEVVGRDAMDLIVPYSSQAYVRMLIDRLAAGDMKASGRNENRTKDGRIITCEWTNTPLMDEMGRFVGVISMVQDVTDKQRLEDQLRHSQKLEAVGRLASGVAHDFNNLLTAIFGYLSLAKATIEPNHPAIQALAQVEEAAQQAAGVTGGLLTFSRKAAPDKASLSMAKVVADAAKLLRRTLPASIRLVVDADGPDATILGDATQIQQVITNLAINSRDAMPDGGELRIELVAPAPVSALPPSAAGEWVQLIVADTGSGMTPEVRGRIFEPFFTTKPRGHGTGLGLSILHGIVVEHGGHIDVSSIEGSGTTVSIVFPVIAPLGSTRRPSQLAPGGQGELILVGEDHQLVREIICAALRAVGYEVVAVMDGREVVRSMHDLGPSVKLLVLDIDLPGMNGMEVLRELQDQGLRRPTVVITGRTTGLEDVELDESTVLLRKPFQVGQLTELVGNVIAGARGGRA